MKGISFEPSESLTLFFFKWNDDVINCSASNLVAFRQTGAVKVALLRPGVVFFRIFSQPISVFHFAYVIEALNGECANMTECIVKAENSAVIPAPAKRRVLEACIPFDSILLFSYFVLCPTI